MMSAPKPIRIASYNIRKAKGIDCRHDPGRILQVINGLGADLVALQEADFRLGARMPAIPRDLITQETDFELLPLGHAEGSLGWHGNAVLVRKSLQVQGYRRIRLPGLEPRGAVIVEIDIGVPVSLVATHLGLLRRHRRHQLAALRAEVRDTTRCVILGDLNEWSRKRGLEPLAGQFITHAPGASFHARRPVAALDRIALSDGLALQQAGVERSPLARKASDHLPVWADIAVTSKTEPAALSA